MGWKVTLPILLEESGRMFREHCLLCSGSKANTWQWKHEKLNAKPETWEVTSVLLGDKSQGFSPALFIALKPPTLWEHHCKQSQRLITKWKAILTVSFVSFESDMVLFKEFYEDFLSFVGSYEPYLHAFSSSSFFLPTIMSNGNRNFWKTCCFSKTYTGLNESLKLYFQILGF